MKGFWKTTLAVVVGLLIASILSSIIALTFCGAALSAGKSVPSGPKDAVLKIDMSKLSFTEQANEMPTFSTNMTQQIDNLGLWDAVRAIKAAAADPQIKMIYLKTDGTATGMATVQELRAALQKFRESGKCIVAYTENPTTGGYYLASVADKVYMTPCLGINPGFVGISGRMIFYKDLLEKLGINVQLIRHGKYKSAGEGYIRNTPSPENMEQNQEMINSVWNSFAAQIAQSRPISVSKLNEVIDNLELCEAQDFVNAGLADELLTKTELENKIATLSQCESFSNVKMYSFADYVAWNNSKPAIGRNKMAIVFFDGQINDGEDIMEVAGDRFAREISKVRADSSIKAVVLRVNSPGGSVLASEKIKNEIDLLGKDKTVIASYGDYAASGGYWISNGASKIFTDETTLTGSIGVFGMIPDFSKTIKNVAHVNVVPVKSHKHSDMYSLTRPFDAQEYAYMQRSIEDVYTKFISIVAEGRDMTVEQVDEIAQGRVWTGSDAMGIGLVDEIGTLDDAVAYAAQICEVPDLKEWTVACYPAPLTAMEQIMQLIGETTTPDNNVLAKQLKAFAKPQIVARMPYDMVIR